LLSAINHVAEASRRQTQAPPLSQSSSLTLPSSSLLLLTSAGTHRRPAGGARQGPEPTMTLVLVETIRGRGARDRHTTRKTDEKKSESGQYKYSRPV